MYAAKDDNLETVKYLHSLGADLDYKDNVSEWLKSNVLC